MCATIFLTKMLRYESLFQGSTKWRVSIYKNKKDLGQCPKPLVSRGFGAVGGI